MMLSSAAALFLAISKADRDVDPQDIFAAWPGYREMSVGFGFLRTAWNWLPELQGFSDAAEACVGVPVLLAYATYNKAIDALPMICVCNQCVGCRGGLQDFDNVATDCCIRTAQDLREEKVSHHTGRKPLVVIIA